MCKRTAGVLLPISALPSRYGIGCLDGAAYSFVDFLHAAGQSEWQILPVGPTGYGDSPYQAFSSYAGNPYFISPDALIEDGLLTRDDWDCAELEGEADRVDYGVQYRRRYPLLRRAYLAAASSHDPSFEHFCLENPWLKEYALFMALKDRHNGAAWSRWEPQLRHREPTVLLRCVQELREDIAFHCFLQYRFFRDWERLRRYAAKAGVRIIGDLPIYVSYDSADVWSSPTLFQLDENLMPEAVSGCPPDGFSPDGQLWGNPLYRWEVHEKQGYQWWVSRFAHAFRLFDAVRIDHFRGFDSYYSIPYGAATAREGAWRQGPGLKLFSALRKTMGELDVIAEDLGFITDSVRALLRETGFPGMRVLQFAFDGRDTGECSLHLPHSYPARCAAYLATHDNQTTASWLESVSEKERARMLAYLAVPTLEGDALRRALIALLMRSPAERVILTAQDWLGLGDGARMNTPSVVGGNWCWRLRQGEMGEAQAQELLRMTAEYGRLNGKKEKGAEE